MGESAGDFRVAQAEAISSKPAVDTLKRQLALAQSENSAACELPESDFALTLDEPTLVLASMRVALRQGYIPVHRVALTKATTTRKDDLVAAWHTALGAHPDPFMRGVAHPVLNRFTASLIKYCNKYVGELPDDERLQAPGLLFLTDIKEMERQEVYHPATTALFHDPSIVDAVRKSCRRYGTFFNPRDYLKFIDRTINPLPAVEVFVGRFIDFRLHTEPRLRKEYTFTGLLNDSVMKDILWRKRDVESYMRKLLESRNMLIQAYPEAPHEEVDELLRRERRSKSGVLDIAALPPRPLNPSETNIAAGHYTLRQIFAAKRDGSLSEVSYKTWPTWEFIRQLRHNPHLYEGWEEGLDVNRVANYLVYSVRSVNAAAAQGKTARVPEDLPSMAGLFCAYLENLSAFQKLAAPSAAARLVKVLTPSEYTHLSEAYGRQYGFTDADMSFLIAGHPNHDPGELLYTTGQLREKFTRQYQGELSGSDIQRIVVCVGADKKAVEARVALLTTTLESTYERVKQDHPWVTRKWAKTFFLDSLEPVKELSEQAAAVDTALTQWGAHRFVNRVVCRRLMQTTNCQSVDTIMKDYIRRIEDLQQECAKYGVTLPDGFLSRWATESPKSYKDKVGLHIEVRDGFRQYFLARGEVFDDRLLSLMANLWPAKAKIASNAQKFLAIRADLADETEGNADVDMSTLNMASLARNIVTARRRLTWWVYLGKRSTSRRTAVTTESSGQRFEGEVDVAVLLDDKLPPLDAAAVKCIFNIPTEYTEDQLRDELDVVDVEAYVYSKILPTLSSLLGVASLDV